MTTFNAMSRLLTAGLSILTFTSALAQTPEPGSAEALELPRKVDKPLESVEGFTTYYDSVEVEDGLRLRSLITVPDGADEPLHPIFFTQWVSCGSLEFPSNRSSLARIARDSGLAMVRVERAGSGDSEGPDCSDLDYDTEVRHYISAFSELLQHPMLDASEVFLFGSSLGSTTAPLVGRALQDNGVNIAGIVVQGGGGLTHFERMLNFDRFYLERRPGQVSPQSIHDEMNARAAFHTEYLIKGRHPDAVAKDSEEMAAVRDDVRGLDADGHYGRPFAWHQQAAQQNFLAAWADLDAEVLVVFNEYDQFETLHGHQLIVDTVNRLRPGTATFVVQEGLGHSGWQYGDAIEAYAGEDGTSAPEVLADTVVTWLKERS